MTNPANISPKSQKDIETWLVKWTAKELSLETETIDVTQSFLSYSTDSLTAMMIVGDLEDWLGCRLSPTLIWDYSTMEKLAEYLLTQVDNVPTTPTATTQNNQQNQEKSEAQTGDNSKKIEPLLDNLDNLSEQEMDALLGQLLVSEQNK